MKTVKFEKRQKTCLVVLAVCMVLRSVQKVISNVVKFTFKLKQSFPFELLSDPDEKVCNAFDVMKLKSMYGRQYIGIDRSTFLINTEGKVIKEWRTVKVKGHVDEVLAAVKDLN